MHLARFGAMLIIIALLVVVLILYTPQITPENEQLFIIIGIIGAVSGTFMINIKQLRDWFYLMFYSTTHYSLKQPQTFPQLEQDLIVQTIGVSLTVLSAIFLGIVSIR